MAVRVTVQAASESESNAGLMVVSTFACCCRCQDCYQHEQAGDPATQATPGHGADCAAVHLYVPVHL